MTDVAARYGDAYSAAHAITGLGHTVKVVGFVAAALTALVGLFLAGAAGASVAVAGIFLAALVAIPFYVLGVIVSALGQVLRATLDTAVNTSPLLSPDEVRTILAASAEAPVLEEQSVVSGDRRSCPRCGRWPPVETKVCECGNVLQP